MYTTRSHLLAPPPNSNIRYKFLSGIAHTQEWERQVSFIGMAFGHDELHAQLYSDALSYTTRSGSSNAPANLGFSSHQSPATGGRGRPRAQDMALQVTDRIPAYDARNTVFDAQTDWPALSRVLPPFHSEVPRGSFAAVGYTCNTYLANDKWNLSCNIQFVVVMGTPDRMHYSFEDSYC
ncbi:hypothetical protein GALMADRAFT_74091 [Galerina marginata CBS 339.88]|uniref:Uncharacterized protein n=1 Tax=Galerina marginata (strain CBS 339.88) TaxID=685588 RepID=A0A067SWX0_GALM3|nr:hypothetical protein GALMADRAFT_74091 [Galerina marginata CBS 339.88]